MIRPALSCWWFSLWFIRQSVGYTHFSLCIYHAVQPNGWDAYDGNYSNTIQLCTCEPCWIEGTTTDWKFSIHWKHSMRNHAPLVRQIVDVSCETKKIIEFFPIAPPTTVLNTKCKRHWIGIICTYVWVCSRDTVNFNAFQYQLLHPYCACVFILLHVFHRVHLRLLHEILLLCYLL